MEIQRECLTCAGTGRVEMLRTDPPELCEQCGGTGQLPDANEGTPEQDPESLDLYWKDLRPEGLQGQPTVPRFRDVTQPGDLVIGSDRERLLVIIRANGDLVFGPEYNPDEAAMVFWEAMGQRRLQMEDRLLVIQHMEAILVRLGRADMECERLRLEAEAQEDPILKASLTQSAEIAMQALNMVAHQAIELGRALVRRPAPGPAVPPEVPESIRQNPNTEYQGREGLPEEDSNGEAI